MQGLIAIYKAHETKAVAEHARLSAATEAERPAINDRLDACYADMERVAGELLDHLLGRTGG